MSLLAFVRNAAGVCMLLTAVACGTDPDGIDGYGGGFPTNDGAVGDGGLPFDAGFGWDSGSQLNDSGVIVVDTDSGCGLVKAQTQPAKGAVDVLWVIDDSGSMFVHIPGVGNNMGRFMNGVRTSGAGIEVIMVAGPIIGSGLQALISDQNYHWVPQPVDSHNSFPIAINSYNDWSKFLRPGAPLHVIFVTDDTAALGWNANRFITELKGKVNKPFTVHAVAADVARGCPGFGPGTEYFSAAKMTGGQELMLCGDWGASFDKLQADVVASIPLPCEYTIPASPNGSVDPNAVQVLFTPNGGPEREFAKASTMDKCANEEAWFFDNNDAPTKVMMCAKGCETVKAGGGITIGFGCKPTVVLQ